LGKVTTQANGAVALLVLLADEKQQAEAFGNSKAGIPLEKKIWRRRILFGRRPLRTC